MVHFLLGIILFLHIFLFPKTEFLDSYQGLVVRIMDGDTFELLVGDSATIKVRMNAIDAPEKRMDFGNVSKYYLGKLIFKKNVLVKKVTTDRYGRLVADVYLDTTYINAEMIRMGMAWHFKKYSKDEYLAEIEQVAISHKIGLWSKKDPIAPWDYRKSKREATLH